MDEMKICNKYRKISPKTDFYNKKTIKMAINKSSIANKDG